MKLTFTKIHSLGNDFVIINALAKEFIPSRTLISKLADRHCGIGCDQVLLLQQPKSFIADFEYQIFNADGSSAFQCGNGVRCLAKFIEIQEISNKKQLIFTTKNTVTKTILRSDGLVTAIIDGPNFEPSNIPIIANKQSLRYNICLLDNIKVEFGAVSVGNPHVVILVDNIATAPVDSWGSLITNHKMFPERINVNFMQIIDRNHISLRVYERGSNETLACGSGACASVVIGKLWELIDEKVLVKLYGGNLCVEWNKVENNISIIGPVEPVFIGEIDL
ncbi:MAG: diaminopimelate epimerase [Coxiellaceae bacterium]|nr:diaminopimelate epimerase [Coxiellaceae bacterium]